MMSGHPPRSRGDCDRLCKPTHNIVIVARPDTLPDHEGIATITVNS